MKSVNFLKYNYSRGMHDICHYVSGMHRVAELSVFENLGFFIRKSYRVTCLASEPACWAGHDPAQCGQVRLAKLEGTKELRSRFGFFEENGIKWINLAHLGSHKNRIEISLCLVLNHLHMESLLYVWEKLYIFL